MKKNSLTYLAQKAITLLYRKPKAKYKLYKRFGGYFNYQGVILGNKQMKNAAARLLPSVSNPDGLPVYFLTGEKYIHQTLFCIKSLINTGMDLYHFILVDDGSFSTEILNLISKMLPGATVVTHDQINVNLHQRLPSDLFPVLNSKRKIYPHIKKLTDIHTIGLTDWKLVLDSDMLFWNVPFELNEWLENPAKPIHMMDCEESYGYSNELMSTLCGTSIPQLLNVGVIGLNSQNINWTNVEHWIQTMESKEGTSYYLEQALTAMLIGNEETVVLDKELYKVNPSDKDMINTDKILHHYVDLSKELYYKKAWQLIN